MAVFDNLKAKKSNEELKVLLNAKWGTTTQTIVLSANSKFGICTAGNYLSQWTFTINGIEKTKGGSFIYETGDKEETLIFKNTQTNPGAAAIAIFELSA